MKNTIKIGLMFICIYTFAACSNGKNDMTEPITVENGILQGVPNTDATVVSFKGIPYAAPPVGDLRWREPQPPVAWQGVRDAANFCLSCYQRLNRSFLPWSEEFLVQNEISEDCLFLNIWAPAHKANAKLPVMVYIHGGAFVEGSGEVAIYDGEQLAKKGIIVINLNYRMGVLGFLAHPELTAESPNHSSGNYGILDIIAALEWVQRNIAQFGGNPDKVTIIGQSAGAMATHFLTASPLAKGLFRGAIAQSGSNMNTFNRAMTLATAEEIGLRFAEAHQVKSIQELRLLPAAELLTTVDNKKYGPMRFSPVLDRWALPASMDSIFMAGLQNDVPTMTGLTADDNGNTAPYIATDMLQFKETMQRQYGERAEQLFALYPVTTNQQAQIATKEISQIQAMISMFEWAKFREKSAKTNLYTYFFNQAIPWPEHPEYGAFHSSELPYTFNNLYIMNRPWTDLDKKVADQVSSYWVNFVKYGNPNGAGLEKWPKFESSKAETMNLGATINTREIATAPKFEFFQTK